VQKEYNTDEHDYTSKMTGWMKIGWKVDKNNLKEGGQDK